MNRLNMKNQKLKIIKFSILALALVAGSVLFSNRAFAADFYIVVDKASAKMGDKIVVDIKIDSQGVAINAAEATVKFPIDILEIASVSKSGSIFGFWLDEPTFSNQTGELKFTGGATTGFSGKTLQVLTVNFTVKGTGKGEVNFSDGAITAADGSGTNVLSKMIGVEIESSPSSGVTPVPPSPPGSPVPPPTPAPAPAPAPIPPPVQIIRPPVASEKLPVMPSLTVSLYPDPKRWYNFASQFSVSWTLPRDISDVSTLINKDPASNPAKSEGLFDNKAFPRLEDGVWYLHVRFKNNVGWGPTAHYRLAIDTAPPLPFEVISAEGVSTDFPNPIISYQTGDSLSGIRNYSIRVDGGPAIDTEETSYKLPLQKPGRHSINVQAVDRAENIAEKILLIDILPIASPVISSINKSVFLGEGGLDIAGTALPDTKIILSIENSLGQIIYSIDTMSDESGVWSRRIDYPLNKGRYSVAAVAEDARGAQSLEVRSDTFAVKSRPLLTLFGLEITAAWFYLGLIAILLSGFLAGYLWNKSNNIKREDRILIAKRDVNTAFEVIKKDVDGLVKIFNGGKMDDTRIAEALLFLKRIEENIAEGRKYLSENIEEIND